MVSSPFLRIGRMANEPCSPREGALPQRVTAPAKMTMSQWSLTVCSPAGLVQ